MNESARLPKRRKSTPWHIRFIDNIASRIITLGGIGTIIAVLLVVVVLVSSVAPLMFSASVGKPSTISIPSHEHPILKAGCDEHEMCYWFLDNKGNIQVVSALTGVSIDTLPPSKNFPDNASVSAVSVSDVVAGQVNGESIQYLLLGLSDGTARMLTLQFLSEYLPEGSDLASVSKKDPKTVYRDVGGGLIRSTKLASVIHSDSWKVGDEGITSLDFLPPTQGNSFSKETQYSWLAVAGGDLVFGQTKSKVNPITKKPKVDTSIQKVNLRMHTEGKVVGMSLDARASSSLIATSLGEVFLFGLSGSQPPERIESFEFKESPKVVPTIAQPLLGRETLLVGDDHGRVFGVFLAKPESGDSSTSTSHLTAVHRMDLGSNPIRSLACSPTSRIIIGVPSHQAPQLAFVPTDETLVKVDFPKSVFPCSDVGFSPKGNSIFVLGEKELVHAEFDQAYPEASFRALFRPIWYEGYETPRYLWQSTSGTAAAEAKLSMIPLVFGTMKATFYTLLIGVPLALLAAIYSSEFMDRKWRARVKPAIELMASIPSVVLGFIAAMVLAPLLRDGIGWAITSLFVVPFLCLLASYLWCLLPSNSMVRYQWTRFPILFGILGMGILVSRPLAPWIEKFLFGVDFKSWLSLSGDHSFGGWFLLLLPLMVLIVAGLSMGVLGVWVRKLALGVTSKQFAWINLARYLISVALLVFITYLLSHLCALWFGDLRSTFYGLYQERNAILVGGILGFAIIPIIYTISDDALQSVPQHLRSASLGCGATPWQTTVRVVVPTAMSGLFSAVMIGFGRAVGETMVVLMAAGNTPVMDLNPFNGYKTLSATLATELPEAAIGSVHFRTLFLAAVILFVLTLIANTVAEVVRSRFRKRAYQL